MSAIFKAIEINALIFQRTPEPFNKDIVHPTPPLAIHRDFNPLIFKDVGKRQACILTALIRVENIVRAVGLSYLTHCHSLSSLTIIA